MIARCVLEVIASADLDEPCGCGDLRKPSLLKIPDEREGAARPSSADPGLRSS
jgi:hypothetical protein